MRGKYRADVDALRALAVSLVLLHHYGCLSGGFIGVDVFFVLSAYLITSMLRASRVPFATFYTRRVRRLFPALFVTLAAAQLCAFALEDVPVVQTSAAVLSSLLSVSNHYFATTVDYFAPTFPNLLLHTWSLSVEEQFYLLWPLLLRVLRNRPTVVLALCITCALITQLAQPRYPRLTFYAAPFRAFEFLAGAYASFHSPRLPRVLVELVFVFGLICIVLPSLLYSAATPFPALTALPPVLGATALLLSSSSVLYARLQHPVVLYLGTISYSLYLLHWPFLVLSRTLLAVEQLSTIQTVLVACATLLCASALHRFVETPLRCASDTTRALTLPWVLPPLALSAAALYGMYLARCDCGGSDGADSASLTFLQALTRAVTASNVTSTAFGARAFGALSPSSNYSVVIGDSHASVLAPLFAYVAWRYHTHVRLHAAAACSPLFGVHKVRVSIGVGQSSVTLPQLQQCHNVVEQWRTVVQQRHVERVFLVSRWTTAVQRGEYFTRGPLAEYRFQESADGSAQPPRLNASRAVFERALRRTVREIQRGGRQVVIVGEPPDLGTGTFNCKRWLRRRRRRRGEAERAQPAACVGAPRALALARLRYANAVIGAVARETRAEALLLSEYLCDNARWDARFCRVVSGGCLLYRDSDHVSAEGAVYLATRWESDRAGCFPRAWRAP